MQQRQLRLGDILDDYCPRERRVTNHAVVAMVGDDVKQTRCATCETEHEYKHAKVPRQRRKADAPAALYAQVLATGPKRVAHEGAHATAADEDSHRDAPADDAEDVEVTQVAELAQPVAAAEPVADTAADRKSETDADPADDEDSERDDEEGPVHRPLIRASLPKHEGQAPPSRPIPEFTIRQPGGRPNRFRPRGAGGAGGGGGGQFGGVGGGGNRGNGNMPGGPRGGGGMRSSGGRPPQGGGGGIPSRMSRRQGPPGRKRSK